jgi:hypothetical protein
MTLGIELEAVAGWATAHPARQTKSKGTKARKASEASEGLLNQLFLCKSCIGDARIGFN